MKKKISIIILVLLALVALWFTFINTSNPFDTTSYEHKIDSLQNQVDSIYGENTKLEESIVFLEDNNLFLLDKEVKLEAKISNLKGDLKKAKNGLKYTPSQVDSFFLVEYTEAYSKPSADTIKLPIEVSKAVVVDLQEGKINEELVLIQDSTISNFKSIIDNKDSTVKLLRLKEKNYLAIDRNRLNQIDNYKIQVGGLREDLNKANRKLKFNKIQKVGLAAILLGFIIIK